MGRFFGFWWVCARNAFWGNSPFANDWQWLVGYPATAALLWVIGYFYAELSGRVQVTLATGAVGVLAAALIAYIITWLTSFFVRLLNQPVILFHEQKNRADKLDGTPLPKKSTPTDKQIAILKERYLSGKPAIQREQLDNLVDGLQALNDVETIFRCLTAETDEVAKSVQWTARNNVKAGSDFKKKRQLITKLAGDLNVYSDRLEEFTNIIRHLTPTFFECTTKFVVNTTLRTEEDYRAVAQFIFHANENVKSVRGCIESLTETSKIISATFRGVSSDLTVSTDRNVSVIGELARALEQYKAACEQIVTLMERKVAVTRET